MLQSSLVVCQSCGNRLLKMSAPDASHYDREIMSVVRETRADRRAALVENWCRSWHKRNCAASKELEALRRANLALTKRLARQEKKSASQPANQAPAAIAKSGHL